MKPRTLILLYALLVLVIPSQPLFSQDDNEASEEEVFELSPFVVSSEGDVGYYASQTLSGGRINTQIEDIGTSVQVVTEELLNDIGATNADSALLYTTNTDVAGPSGNISSPSSDAAGTPDDSPLRLNPAGNNRIRAIGSADLTRNYFRTEIPFDRYNSGRLDILRGANSFLFGLGSPSGIINYSLDRAEFRDFGEIGIWFSNEGLENNFSRRFDININRELLDDVLAVRFAGLMDREEYIQELAHRDTDRYYGSLTYRPFKDRNIFLRMYGETGELRSTPPSALGPLEAITPWLENLVDVDFGGPANRFVGDPFNNVVNENVDYQGTDADGNIVSFERGGTFISARKWALVYDGTEDAAGLPTRAVQNGVDGNMWVPGDPLFDPDANFTGDEGIYFLAFPNLHEIGGDFAGYLPQGLTDYSFFNFQEELITGGFDQVDWDYDNYNIVLEATTRSQNFGIELAINDESVVQKATLPIRNPTLYMDVNRTHVIGPNSLFGDTNPNFGRIFVTGVNSTRTVTEIDRETLRATAFGRFDFNEQFEGNGFLSWLGRHTATLLLDSDKRRERSTEERIYAFGNNVDWHLAQPDATQFQRQVNYTVYVSDAYPEAFTDPNFTLQDFSIHPRTDINLTLPGDFSIPVAYYDLGEPYWKADPVNWPAGVVSRGSSQVAPFNPGYGNADGTLSEEEVESYALNTQSFFLRDHLVVNLGLRRDKWESSRVSAPVSTDPADEGQRDFSPEAFNLDGVETQEIEDDNFSYNFVLKAPSSWLPEGYGFSVHYGESSNFIPATSAFDIDGTPVPSGSGENTDYGFTIQAFDRKLVARVNWYETDITNEPFEDVSFAFAWTATAHLTRQYARLTEELYRVDPDGDGQYESGDADGNGILDSRDADGREYVSLPELRQVHAVYDSLMFPYLREVNNVEFNENTGRVSQGNGAFFTLADTADVKAEGLEIEAIYNPSRALRLGLTIVKQKASRTNLAPRFGEMFNKLVAVQEAVPAIKGANLGANKLGVPLSPNVTATNRMWGQLTAFRFSGQAYYKNTALAGADNPEVRKWRVSLYGNYSFTDGPLQRFNVGGAYRYVDDAAIGYGLKVVGEDLLIPDVETVYYGRDQHSFDLWVGYNFRIKRGVTWRIQLNVRNLFADSDPLPVQTQPDGSVARVRYAPPRTFLLQNTIRF